MAKYFKPAEFRCKCRRCVNAPDPVMSDRLLTVLDKIREAVGAPVIVTSGYRCPDHNKEVGGVCESQHTKRTAADIQAVGVSVEALARAAECAGADGIGRYPKRGFVHVDARGQRARWVG
jgi:uncharacterized protein YcbK (DUF882 family)